MALTAWFLVFWLEARADDPVIGLSPHVRNVIAENRDELLVNQALQFKITQLQKRVEPMDTTLGTGLVLPFEVALPDIQGTKPPIVLKPFAQPQSLMWDKTAKQFRGAMHMSLLDEQKLGIHPLGAVLKATISSSVARIEPATVEITRANDPVPCRIEYTGNGDTVPVSVTVLGLNAPISVDVPVTRPHLEVEISPLGIQGFGLETATVQVTDDSFVSEVVTLSATSGRLTTTELTMVNGTGKVEIRSSGLGPATVQAAAPGFVDAQAIVRYKFPIAFLISSLIGGVAGGALRGIPGDADGRWKRAGMAVGIGALAGLVIVIAAAIGVNVTGLSLGTGFNEAVVFIISAIGAYGADKLVSMLMSR